MDTKSVKKHPITLKEIKKAAVLVVGHANALAYRLKLEKDMHNGVNPYHFKLTLTVYHKNRTSNLKYEFYADTKKGLIVNMLNLNNIDEFEACFVPPFGTI